MMNVLRELPLPVRTQITRAPRKIAWKNVCLILDFNDALLSTSYADLFSSFPSSTLRHAMCRWQALQAAQVDESHYNDHSYQSVRPSCSAWSHRQGSVSTMNSYLSIPSLLIRTLRASCNKASFFTFSSKLAVDGDHQNMSHFTYPPRLYSYPSQIMRKKNKIKICPTRVRVAGMI